MINLFCLSIMKKAYNILFNTPVVWLQVLLRVVEVLVCISALTMFDA